MTREEAIDIIKAERTCVERQGRTGECCRDDLGCGACDLVMEDVDIIKAYDMAIEALKTDIDLDDAYEQGYACGWKERFGEPKGLHGEWIIHRNKQGSHIYSVCSKCNVPHLDTDFPNFCENCGSDNRPRLLDEAVDGEGKDGNVKEGEAE